MGGSEVGGGYRGQKLISDRPTKLSRLLTKLNNFSSEHLPIQMGGVGGGGGDQRWEGGIGDRN